MCSGLVDVWDEISDCGELFGVRVELGSHRMGDFSLVLLECGIVCGVIEKVGMYVRLD